MPKALWLPKVLRDAGLKVEVLPGWEDRGRTSDGGLLDIRALVAHHTAGPKTGVRPSLKTVVEGRSDLEGPLAQLFLDRNGIWVVVAAGKSNSNGQVEHIDYTNAHTINVEAEAAGLGSKSPDDWPPVQYRAYGLGMAAMANHLKLPTRKVVGHKEICVPVGRKVDPSFDMRIFRQTVDRYRDQLVEDSSRDNDRPSVPNPAFTLDHLLYYRKGNLFRGKTVLAVQIALAKAGIDMSASRRKNGTYDGIFGPGMKAAVERFQRRKSIDDDGVVGKITAVKLGGRWTGPK